MGNQDIGESMHQQLNLPIVLEVFRLLRLLKMIRFKDVQVQKIKTNRSIQIYNAAISMKQKPTVVLPACLDENYTMSGGKCTYCPQGASVGKVIGALAGVM